MPDWLNRLSKVGSDLSDGLLSNFARLFPFSNEQGPGDLQYLRGVVKRDMRWVETLLVGEPDSEILHRCHDELRKLAETPRPADVPAAWTDYGAVRLLLLGAVPPEARSAALAELRAMSRVVLPHFATRWAATADYAAQLIDADASDQRVPHLLQQLFREVDYGRSYLALRISKYTALANSTWLLICGFTAGITYFLSEWRTGDAHHPVVWLLALFGLLGGSVSALRENENLPRAVRGTLHIKEVQLRLRPVLGAMSAVVMYAIMQSEIVFSVVASGTEASSALVRIHVANDNIPMAYYSIAFVTGFSERFFLSVVNQIAERAVPEPPHVAPTPAAAPQEPTVPATSRAKDDNDDKGDKQGGVSSPKGGDPSRPAAGDDGKLAP
ncbi:MAG: hypothetical protein KC731_09050 [Myxococcales bacterium]|nr:hypothetical protein [Myxococcales bacterium]